ncbi:adenylate cyclase [Thalassospira sp. MBR-102]
MGSPYCQEDWANRMNQVIARTQVSYEVYVKDRSGRWEIHAHFTGAQKKQAEEEARSLEKMAHVSAVKVIREVYNHATNAADEYVIYETRQSGAKDKPQNAPKTAPTRPAPARAPASPPEQVSTPAPKPARTKVKTASPDESPGLIAVALKLVMAFCIAIAIGLAAMLGASHGLEYLPRMGLSISQGFYDKANFISFIVGFLASATPMLMSITSKFKGKARTEPAQKPGAKRSARPGRKTASPNRPSLSGSFAEMAAEVARSENEAMPDIDADETDDTQSASEPRDDGIPDQPMTVTPALQATREVMKSFIAGSIEAIKRTVPNMDAYHKFGVNLYVAGACDACSEKNALGTSQGRSVLKDCISALGATHNMADTFCKNVDSYILEPKYKDMYGAGRSSMDAYMKDEQSITTSVSRAIASWSEKPTGAPANANNKLHALMFTDIVNSTQMTQQLGDVGAQKMVHIHNQIVRTALINNYGKEVKHMGDGIMAVFPSSASSVEAAIEIQRNMAQHNGREDLKFQIRIGINAGEAIAEENDLFGSVVQLAARVCAQAGGDEILVSQNVKDTYAGSRATFTSKGTRQMKGFAEPIEVFAATPRA